MTKWLDVLHVSFKGSKSYLRVSWDVSFFKKNYVLKKYSQNKFGASWITKCVLKYAVMLMSLWTNDDPKQRPPMEPLLLVNMPHELVQPRNWSSWAAKWGRIIFFSFRFWCMLFNFNKNEFLFRRQRAIILFEVLLKVVFVNSITHN